MERPELQEADKSPVGGRTKNAHRLFIWGVITSSTYAAAMAIYACFTWRNMLGMAPDELATFISGVFAPLAFLWLVLGFRQQGDELQNSARALWLQGEELRNSVEQQRQLVEVSREQLSAEHSARQSEEQEADRAAQPQLILSGAGGSYSGPKRTLNTRLSNAGPACADMQVIVNGEDKFSRAVFREGDDCNLHFEYASPDEVVKLSVTVKYSDRRGNLRAQLFEVPVKENGGPNKDRTLGEPIKLRGVLKLDS